MAEPTQPVKNAAPPHAESDDERCPYKASDPHCSMSQGDVMFVGRDDAWHFTFAPFTVTIAADDIAYTFGTASAPKLDDLTPMALAVLSAMVNSVAERIDDKLAEQRAAP